MKKIFKRNQIIVTTLAIMIAVAGYITYADNNVKTGSNAKNNNSLTENSGESEAAAKENPGEAVLVSGQTVLAKIKTEREEARASNKESLMAIIDNSEISEQNKASAVSMMVELTDSTEKEVACESMLASKGFENCVVSINNGKADVAIGKSQLSDQEKAQIEDVVKRKTAISIENIVITPAKE